MVADGAQLLRQARAAQHPQLTLVLGTVLGDVEALAEVLRGRKRLLAAFIAALEGARSGAAEGREQLLLRLHAVLAKRA